MDLFDLAIQRAIGDGGVTPTGELPITSNGTYDVTNYASASVNVPGIIPTGEISIAQNGTYDVTNYASAYVNNSSTGVELRHFVIRPDAELVQTWSLDKLVHEDLSWAIPTYTTSQYTIHNSTAIDTYTISSSYDYIVIGRGLLTPVYTSSSVEKAKPIYNACYSIGQVTRIPSGTFSWSNMSVGETLVIEYSGGWRTLYGKSYTGIDVTTGPDGVWQRFDSIATHNGDVLTINDPALLIRGGGTYFNSTSWSQLTDLRRQYKIELYRAPKNNLNFDGWYNYDLIKHIVNDAQGTGTLT